MPEVASTEESPLSGANTCCSSPLSPSLLVSSLFLPSQREQSLTALQDLPERDQILSKATTWKSQDRFSVTERIRVNSNTPHPSPLFA